MRQIDRHINRYIKKKNPSRGQAGALYLLVRRQSKSRCHFLYFFGERVLCDKSPKKHYSFNMLLDLIVYYLLGILVSIFMRDVDLLFFGFFIVLPLFSFRIRVNLASK